MYIPRGHAMARLARAICIAKGSAKTALAFAQEQKWNDSPEVLTLLKAAVTPLGTADVDQASRAVASDFAEALRPRTIIGRLTGLRPALFLTRSIVATSGATAAWVGEGLPTPAAAQALTSAVALSHLKASGLAVLTNELLASPSPKADEVVTADLVRSCAMAADLAFIDPTNAGVADAKPASVTYGAPSVASTGAALANVDEDLRAVIEKTCDNEQGLISPAWIMNPWTATYLGTLRGSGGAPAFPDVGPRGGTLLGIPVLTTTGVQRLGSPSSSYLALVDADDILLADDDEAMVDYSSATALQMVDNPSGAATIISMFQTNSAAARVTRWLNWHARRASAATVLTGIAY